MPPLLDTRRYLTDFDSKRTGNLLTDVLVIGSGIAGARAAIEAARHGNVTLITKGTFDQSTTYCAQGGIAAALGPNDSPDRHLEDTLKVGGGLNRKAAVELLVRDAPQRIEELLSWGASLDRYDGELALTREGGHTLQRVAHAGGDRTGVELVRILERRVRETEGIRLFEHCFLIDLISVDSVCMGAVVFHDKHGHQLIWARQTILAAGGCGQVWRETTNPAITTGDGFATAFRAGARLCNLELMQFHPTTLYIAGAVRALISEAVRGEGARLVDKAEERFMDDYHPDGELAPRDVVSRAIHTHLIKTQSNCVYLDVRHIKDFHRRFPQISKLCADFEIDVSRQLIPVRPSAHYMIGGVDVALDSSSSIDGLLCCGEVCCSGVHGANRLASNSLLEGLVFGKIAGMTAGRRLDEAHKGALVHQIETATPPSSRTELDLADICNSLRSLMWHNVGIERTGPRLIETCDIIGFWSDYTLDKTFDEPYGWEVQNQLTLAWVIASGALKRTEPAGVHFRRDASDNATPTTYDIVTTRNSNGTEPQRREHTNTASA